MTIAPTSSSFRLSGLIRPFVKYGFRDAAFVVELDHLAKRRNRSVVHVRRVLGDVAQHRRLECAVVLGLLRDREASFVLECLRLRIPADAGVVKEAVAEVAPDVALHAAGRIEEQIVAAFRGSRHRILLVIEPPAVVRRVAADARALVIGNRLRDTLLGDLHGAEGFLEIRFIALHARERWQS